MSVDYSAHLGIGFKLRHPQSNENFEKIWEGDFIGFFQEEIRPLIDQQTDYEFFEVGEGAYDGTENEIYVVVKGSLKQGWDKMKEKTEKLKTFLWSIDLISLEDQADIVGGLEVY